jgi:molybdopterin-binding protein
MLSARNQFKGTVKSVRVDGLMAEVIVTSGGIDITSVITRGAVDAMDLREGDAVAAVIKSTEVMIEK